MSIRFYWYSWSSEKSNLLPAAEVMGADEKMTNCLNGILMDDGGGSFENTILWLEYGLKIFENIKSNHNDAVFWDRDSWGSTCINSEVKLYSLYDDEYSVNLTLSCFKEILKAWLDFNKSVLGLELDCFLEI